MNECHAPYLMDTKTTFDCATFGFDNARIQEALSVLGLHAEHAKLAERIRSEAAEGEAEALVHSCCVALARERSFALIERSMGIECFTQTWTRHLRDYGQDFDTPKYFGERLAIAAAFVRAKIPLGILQLQHSLTQQALINNLSVKFADDTATLRPLIDCILKLNSLDVYLSAEGYRLPQIDELRKALTRLRKETSHWHQEASTDQLTGLMRYNTLMETLDHHINMAHRGHDGRSGSPLCVAMIDLDFFKKINDTHGHVVGDFVLKHVAGRIQAAVRDFDMVGRFGGEEFVIIMTSTHLELAKVIAERIRKGVMETPLHLKELSIPVTISVGVAMLRPGERKETLIERADKAMYKAKEAGRNRVMLAKDTGDTSDLETLPEL
ncbi:diguanylate cyclase (GGDEF) domain-containing protein [Nitrosospira sp. Nsp13]|nr:diguanylate cyclase (GGDEF) domain-containing protein [Nitrosospira sp. Nsp13]